ncbi:EF-hand domain-containing protein [Isosphaeraceae bacterium EP7]
MQSLRKIAMTGGLLFLSTNAWAQQGPGGGPPPGQGGPGGDLTARMMAFDSDNDGKITKVEVTDERLQRLFERADADNDGSVSKDELTTFAAQQPRGGPGGPGGPGGMSRPGEILSQPVRRRLKLTATQEKRIAALQKDVDTKLAAILDKSQEKLLAQMKTNPGGPGGPGGRGGPGGFGGPGGPPPGGFGGPGGPPPDGFGGQNGQDQGFEQPQE